MTTKESNPKDIIGCKKPPLSVLPWPVLFEVGVGMLEGACKYGRHNYRTIGVRASIYFDATTRHLALWWEGEDIDKDSGLNHITKAIASLVVLRDAQMRDMVNDDRPPRFDNDPGRDKWIAQMQDKVDNVLAKHPDPLPPYTEEKQDDFIPDGVGITMRAGERAAASPNMGGVDGADICSDVVSNIAVRSLNKDDIFSCREGTFKVDCHIRANDTVCAVRRVSDGSYADQEWTFQGNYRVEFKGAGK